jgi:FkbM family methyltransferase
MSEGIPEQTLLAPQRPKGSGKLLDTLDKVTRLIEVAGTPGGLRALLLRRPRSLSAFRLTRGIANEGLSFGTVIDVGANIGQFSRAALATWPGADVIAFEALPEAASLLRGYLGAFGNFELHEVALGRADGAIQFHPHTYSPSSSLLPIAKEAQDRYSWADERPAIEVQLCRLDGLLAGRPLRRPVLAKLDVQGYELEVLAGAEETLRRTDALLIEASFLRFYEGQPLFGEIHATLEKGGWELIRPLDWRREGGGMVEVDCLYRSRLSQQAA